MVIESRRSIKLFDSKFKEKGVYAAEVTELTMSQASMLSDVIDASKSIAVTVRLKYKQNNLRSGYIQLDGYPNLFSIIKNVSVFRSTTFYAVESSRKKDV